MTTATADVTNPEQRERMLEAAREEARSEQVEHLEHASTKQWLETKLDEQARPVPVLGREFLFRPIGNKQVEEAMQLFVDEAAALEGNDIDDLDDLDDVEESDLEEMPKLLATVRSLLEEHCLDEYMAEEGIGRLPATELLDVFDRLASDAGLMAEEKERAHSFRDE